MQLPVRLACVTALSMLFAAGASAACKTMRVLPPTPHGAQAGISELSFVAADLHTNTCWTTDPRKIRARHAPWSTFKIPHSLIALETGVLRSAQDRIAWDPERMRAESYWPGDWARDQTLESAFQRSTAWAYQELAPRIGNAHYRRWLARFRYGNRAAQAGVRPFWLGSSLQISPLEQLAFLSCLAKTGCGVAPSSLAVLKEIALDDETETRKLYAKSGSGPQRPDAYDGPFEGWFVGYILDAGHRPVAAFALFAKGDSFSTLRAYRRDTAIALLTQLGMWRP